MKFSIGLSLALVPCGIVVPAVTAHASDFNGDGRADLVMAVRPTANEGAVHVLYGTVGGLSSNGMQTLLAQTTPVISYPAIDGFGEAIAAGDFDHDGFDDLAVGVPNANFKQIAGVGCVNVFRGSANGLLPASVLHQNKGGMKDKCELGEHFGWSLAAGDFDHDGFADLAVGVLETIGKLETAGAVHVVYGSKKGLSGKKDQVWTQNSKGVEGVAEADDAFGSVLAAGDADGDGYDDLAIGIPYESTDHGGTPVEGAVALLRGGKKGLTNKNDALFDNADLNPANYDPSGFFGRSLAFCDFDGDGKRHLVIGAPGWDVVATNSNDGAVFFVPVSSTGVDFAAHTSLAIVAGGYFGYALEVGNFNGDGFEDLAVGAPLSSFLTNVDAAGIAVVLRGTTTGLDALNPVYLTRSTPDVLGTANPYATFGLALAAGDFDGDGRHDLAIGAPNDTIGTAKNCGGINVLRGSSTSLVTATNSQWWFGSPFGATQSAQWMGFHLR